MNQSDSPALLGGLRIDARFAEGYDALTRGDWQRARDYFEAALDQERSPEALEALGLAVSQSMDDAVFEIRESAYELYRRRDDRLGAARIALALTVDCATLRGEMALANGWLQRAHTLLDALPTVAEHGWLEYTESQKFLIAFNDNDAARLHAANAVAISRSHKDPDLEAGALALEGVALVTSGAVQEGLACLDEAGASCLSGEVKAPWVISSVMCQIMDACDRARDWERAREWYAHVERLATRWNDPILYGQCRPHYAVVLTWRGAWRDAERELQLSIDDLGGPAKPMAVEGIVRLAELRWRQGRLDDAAALFEQVKNEPLAQLGQALLALEHNDPTLALEYVERCLRRLPPQDRLERLPAIELHLRACLALDEADRAREVLPELQEMVRNIHTRPLQASANLALGLIASAEGRGEEARTHLEDAVDLFDGCGAPFEAGRARLDLARIQIALKRPRAAAACAAEALSAFTDLGALREAARARDLLALARMPDAPEAQPRLTYGLTRREVEVLQLLASGLSNQEIADRLVLSIRTVQRHVENIYAKTGARGRAAAAVFAATHAIVTNT